MSVFALTLLQTTLCACSEHRHRQQTVSCIHMGNTKWRTKKDNTAITKDKTASASIPRQTSAEISGSSRACAAKLPISTQKITNDALLDRIFRFDGVWQTKTDFMPCCRRHFLPSHVGGAPLVFTRKMAMRTRTENPTAPVIMTVKGKAPASPPRQKRCPPHLAPVLVTEPLPQTCPNDASHGLHDQLPFPANSPTPHRRHVADDVAPWWGDDVPASQAVQAVDDAD